MLGLDWQAEEEADVEEAPKPKPKPTATTPKATKPSGWQTLCEEACAEGASPSPPVAAPATGLPLDDDHNLPFFFLDAFEQPHDSNGTVYLFGKVRAPAAPRSLLLFVGFHQMRGCCLVVFQIISPDVNGAANSVAGRHNARCRCGCVIVLRSRPCSQGY